MILQSSLYYKYNFPNIYIALSGSGSSKIEVLPLDPCYTLRGLFDKPQWPGWEILPSTNDEITT